MKTHLKTPISYYGGKQLMLRDILPLIPEHTTYCEPFCGGAAVFWAKEPSSIEIINDLNSEVVNFYKILKTSFDELYCLTQTTLHSKAQYEVATVIYKHPEIFTAVQRAWAFWMSCIQSYLSSPTNGWAYNKTKKNSQATKVYHSKERLQEMYSSRLSKVSLECDNALKVIERFDTQESFFYVDPPYFNSDMGHYGGYSASDLENLLRVLSRIEGKFLLSSYPSELLDSFVEEYGWVKKEIVKNLCASKGKKKVEVLTSNYPIT